MNDLLLSLSWSVIGLVVGAVLGLELRTWHG